MTIFTQRSFASPRRHPLNAMRAILIMAAVLLSFAAAQSASAATVLRLDMQSLVANSDQIVEGEVTEVEARVEDGRVYTYTTVKVADAFKGAETGESVTIKQIGGRTPDLATRVAGSPHFQSGERVIVFLEKASVEAMPVITGMAQGKFQVALGPDNITPYVVPYLGDLALTMPKVEAAQGTAQAQRFERAEPADLYLKVRSLDDFKQEIRQVVNEQK